MSGIYQLVETYLFVLVHPYRIHHSIRHHLGFPGDANFNPSPLTLAEAISISWLFSIIKGFGKLIILNFFLQTLWTFNSEELSFLSPVFESAGLSAYYFFLFSILLDVIFFPVVAMVKTEIWSFIIRFYARILNPELPRELIADQVTTHALSSNLFVMIPIFGDLVQFALYYFLLYSGLRANLGATRGLSFVILLSPFVLLFMTLTTITLTFFIAFS